MRIGISVFGCAGGKTKGSGTAVYAKNLIKNLAAIDRDNEYFIFLSGKNQKEFSRIERDNFHFKVIPLPETGFARVLFEQFILPALSVVYKIELMHYIMPRMPFAYTPESVITVHDLMYRYYNEHYPGRMPYLKYLYFDLNMRKILKKAGRIIAVSGYTAQKLREYFNIGSKTINVIYEGVDPVFSRNLPKGLPGGRGETEDKYILTVKSNFPHKNFKSLLEAFILAKNRYRIPHKLLVLGYSISSDGRARELIRQSGMDKEVVFLRNVPEEELADIYKKASLFVFLSLNEGFGLPVLEAMAAGVPVICSGRASLPEISREAAWVVDPLDAEKIGESIHNCLNDVALREEMINKGLERADKLSWRETARQTLEVYHSAAGALLSRKRQIRCPLSTKAGI